MKGTRFLATKNKEVKEDKIMTLSSNLNCLHFKCFSSSLKVFRIGVNFNLLFNNNVPLQKLNDLLTLDLKDIQQKLPALSLTRTLLQSIAWNEGALWVSQCNFLAPEYTWIETLKNAEFVTLSIYINRFEDLLSHRYLSFWQVAEFVEGFLFAVAGKYSQGLAHKLAFLLLDATLASYLKYSLSKRIPPNNFYSFVFNLFQECFVKYGYDISISKSLVTANLPVDFLIAFYGHSKNKASRDDLWNWGDENQNGVVFADHFDQFWLDNYYNLDEIEYFKRSIFPLFSINKAPEFKQSQNAQRFSFSPMYILPYDYAVQRMYNNSF